MLVIPPLLKYLMPFPGCLTLSAVTGDLEPLAASSVVYRLAVSAGRSLTVQNLRPTADLLTQKLCFNKIPLIIICLLKFKNPCVGLIQQVPLIQSGNHRIRVSELGKGL